MNHIKSLEEFKRRYERIDSHLERISLGAISSLAFVVFIGSYKGTNLSALLAIVFVSVICGVSGVVLYATPLLEKMSDWHKNRLFNKTNNEKFHQSFLTLWNTHKTHLSVVQNKDAYLICNYWSGNIFMAQSLHQGWEKLYQLSLHLTS